MLPLSNSPDHHHLIKKHKTPPDLSNHHLTPKPYSLSYFLHHLSHSPRLCLIITILSLQLLLLSFSHYIPTFLSHHTPITTTLQPIKTILPDPNPKPKLNPIPITRKPKRCEYGKFYVYEMPPEFNKEIIENCETMSPFGSRCGPFSNNGFGPKALGIERVIPRNLSSKWYWTDQFANELLYHTRLLNHKCRTKKPQSATAFYIPAYIGLAAEKYLWDGNATNEIRDNLCVKMLDWVQTQSPYFNKSKGLDHFYSVSRITWDFRRSEKENWGSRCFYMSRMWNITRLLIERDHNDLSDVGVPYPTGFHPETPNDIVSWQDFVRSRERHSMFCFAGGTRGLIQNDFRAVLLSQCQDSAGSCRVVDCSGTRCANGTSEILETFLDSDFCLQPRGDSYTRRSTFDCLLAGSIPVFFWKRTAYLQYEWFLPDEPESYSVFIHRNEVKNGTSIKSVLEKISKEEIKRMREKIVNEIIPKIVYAKPNEGLGKAKDAVDVAVDGVLRRVKDRKDQGYFR